MKKDIIVFHKVLLSVTFFMSRLLQYDFFVVLRNFLQKLLCEVLLIIFSSVLQRLISWSRHFHNCFVKLIKGASLAQTYFLLIGAYLLNILKTVSFKVLRWVALDYFRSEHIVAKVFVITVFDDFRLSFLKTRFKFCCSK